MENCETFLEDSADVYYTVKSVVDKVGRSAKFLINYAMYAIGKTR